MSPLRAPAALLLANAPRIACREHLAAGTRLGTRPISAPRFWISEGLTQEYQSEMFMTMGYFPESLRQAIFVGIILVGRLGVATSTYARIARDRVSVAAGCATRRKGLRTVHMGTFNIGNFTSQEFYMFCAVFAAVLRMIPEICRDCHLTLAKWPTSIA